MLAHWSLESRFWRHVDRRGPEECWPWTAVKDRSGYGKIRSGQRMLYATRVAMELDGRPRHDGMFVRHSCDNPPCCNPAHLEWGTHADNMRDRSARGRTATGQRNAATKLSQDLAAKILLALANGSPQQRVAVQFGIAQSTVSDVALGKRWTQVGR